MAHPTEPAPDRAATGTDAAHAGRIAWISIAPVKSMALQALTEAEIGARGIAGDRRFVVLDGAGRLCNGVRLGRLAAIHPTVAPDGTHLALRFPDGTRVEGDVVRTERLAVDFYGATRTLHGLSGPFDAALSAWAGMPLRLVEADRPGEALDRLPKGGHVTIVSARGLAEVALAGGLDDPLDQRRFRLTLGVEGAPAWAEDGWVGRPLHVGAATIRPGGDVGRCAVTTCDPDTGEPDADTLRWLRAIRGHRATGERLPFGVYARVATPGRVRLGDPVIVGAAGRSAG